jgi:hypothetical protein
VPSRVAARAVVRRICPHAIHHPDLVTLIDEDRAGKRQQELCRPGRAFLPEPGREPRKVVVRKRPRDPSQPLPLGDHLRPALLVERGVEELERKREIEVLEIRPEVACGSIDLTHKEGIPRRFAHRLERDANLGPGFGMDVLKAPVLVSQRQRKGHRRDRVVAKVWILHQLLDGIDPEPVHAPAGPEADHIAHRGADLRHAPVEIGLLGIERVEVIAAGQLVERPGGSPESRDPIVGRLIRPHVVLRVLAEPSVLDRGMGRNEVEEDLELQLMGTGDEPVEAAEVSQLGRHLAVISDVVAHVRQGRGVDRREPQRIDAQVGKVVQARFDPRQVADAIAVRILKRARIDLVDDRVVPPPVVSGHRAVLAALASVALAYDPG